MCRLFGFRSAVPSRAHRSLVDAENALSAQSQRHPDGWGIGYFVDNDAYVLKAGTSAHASKRFARASARLTSHTFVVHVRRATVGSVDHLNAHPFRFGRWLFAHNGTVFGFAQAVQAWMLERTEPVYHPLILGDTDSEHLFFYLLSAIRRSGLDPSGHAPSNANVAGRAVRDALTALDKLAVDQGHHRPIVNVLLTDGRTFVAHRAGMPLMLSTQKMHCADFPTCTAMKVCMETTRPDGFPVNHLLVASEPIGIGENRWEDVADGATVVLDGGFSLHVVPPRRGWVAPELPPEYRSAPATSV